jgi:hypothetical protein
VPAVEKSRPSPPSFVASRSFPRVRQISDSDPLDTHRVLELREVFMEDFQTTFDLVGWLRQKWS